MEYKENNIRKMTNATMNTKCFFLICFFICVVTFLSQAQCDGCRELRRNVVRIHSTYDNFEDDNGFGFIIAEESGLLYIITASHVVNSINGANLKNVNVTFYDKQFQDKPWCLPWRINNDV